MSYLTQMLKLSDSASDQAIREAVQGLITLRDSLQAENATLKSEKQTLQERVTAFETKEKEANKQKAVALVDAAVKDGRIDAKGRESWLEDFAVDLQRPKYASAPFPYVSLSVPRYRPEERPEETCSWQT